MFTVTLFKKLCVYTAIPVGNWPNKDIFPIHSQCIYNGICWQIILAIYSKHQVLMSVFQFKEQGFLSRQMVSNYPRRNPL